MGITIDEFLEVQQTVLEKGEQIGTAFKPNRTPDRPLKGDRTATGPRVTAARIASARALQEWQPLYEALGTPPPVPPTTAPSTTASKQFSAEERARIELARRELARRSLVNFILRFQGDYKAGWVHLLICAKLEQFARDVIAEKSPRLMLFLPPRTGKLCADSTPVLTTRGWTTHGELRVGDEVFHPSGKPTRVVAVGAPDLATVEVELTNGEVIKVHPDHEWTIYDRSYRVWRTVETRYFYELTNRGSQRIIWSSDRALYQLPPTAALEFPEADLPVAPYALGAWLGDGTVGKPCITHDARDEPMVTRMTADGYAVSTVCVHRTTGVPTTYFGGVAHSKVAGRFTQALRAAGVYLDKRIPELYQRASIRQRLDLLAGLIDSDGTVDKHLRVTISTTRDGLADDIGELVQGLGWRVSRCIYPPVTTSSGIVGRLPVHAISFSPDCEIPTVLPRKRIVAPKPAARRIGIRAVRPATPEKGRCIQVEAPDGLYVVGRKLVATHNSLIASQMFPAWFLGHYPDKEIIACSYAVALPLEFSRQIRRILGLPTCQAVFPDATLSKTSAAAEAWRLEKGGGYVAAGVSGPITGKGCNCVAPYSTVRTRHHGILPISKVSNGDWVYGYNHALQRAEWVRVDAICVTRAGDRTRMLSITPSGPVVTPEHRIFVPGRGYVPAGESQGLPLLRCQEGPACGDVQEVSLGRAAVAGQSRLCAVWERGSAPAGGDRESATPTWRQHKDLLQQKLSMGVSRGAPTGVSQGPRRLRAVRHGVAGEEAQQVLLIRLLQRVQSFAAHSARIFRRLFGPQVGCLCAGSTGVSALWEDRREDRSPPYRQRPNEQHDVEFGDSLHQMSQVVSHDNGTCAEEIATILGGEDEYVVDLQTSTQNFFCDDVLVHNCLILDDVVKDAEAADSEVMSEATWNWYGSTARTRLAPGGGILVIMTRWSEKDLAGRLLHAEQSARRDIAERLVDDASAAKDLATLENWEVLSFPAIAEHDEYLNPAGELIYADRVSPSSPALAQLEGHVRLRRVGDPLHPERFSLESLQKVRRTLQPRHWQSLYQQNPTPEEGSYFTKDGLRFTTTVPDWGAMRRFAAWDLAIGQKQKNDWTVGVVGGLDWHGDLHILEMIRGRMDAHDIAVAIVETAVKYQCALTGIEKGQLELAIRPELERVMRDRHKTITLAENDEALRPMTDKIARARPLQGMLQRGRVWLPQDQPWAQTAVSELLRFPNGLNDDIVDALAWLARMTINAALPPSPQAQFRNPVKSWKDRLKGTGSGRRHFMAS